MNAINYYSAFGISLRAEERPDGLSPDLSYSYALRTATTTIVETEDVDLEVTVTATAAAAVSCSHEVLVGQANRRGQFGDYHTYRI